MHRRSDIKHFEYGELLHLAESDAPGEIDYTSSYDFSTYSIGELCRYAADPEVSRPDKYMKILIFAAMSEQRPSLQQELRSAFPRIVHSMVKAHDKQMDSAALADLEMAVEYISGKLNVN